MSTLTILMLLWVLIVFLFLTVALAALYALNEFVKFVEFGREEAKWIRRVLISTHTLTHSTNDVATSSAKCVLQMHQAMARKLEEDEAAARRRKDKCYLHKTN